MLCGELKEGDADVKLDAVWNDSEPPRLPVDGERLFPVGEDQLDADARGDRKQRGTDAAQAPKAEILGERLHRLRRLPPVQADRIVDPDAKGGPALFHYNNTVALAGDGVKVKTVRWGSAPSSCHGLERCARAQLRTPAVHPVKLDVFRPGIREAALSIFQPYITN